MIVITILMVCIAVFTLYVIIDNYRVNININDVFIDRLPKAFNNYKILQITDLHSKQFGKKLYEKINSIDYDMIAFTGDMINNKDTNMKSFVNLINNIKNKKLMIYVDGNNGPKTYDEENNEITEFGFKVQSLGCVLLTDIYCIEKGKSKIWLSNFDISTNILCYKKNIKHGELFKKKISSIGNDVSIGIGHEPVNKTILKYISMNKIKYYKYDLIIVGHYHAGQIRVPFYGAIYVPTNNPSESFFPDQDIVSGLYSYKNVHQYVSAGLGASKRVPLFNFRLFNTPQIDVIKLKTR